AGRSTAELPPAQATRLAARVSRMGGSPSPRSCAFPLSATMPEGPGSGADLAAPTISVLKRGLVAAAVLLVALPAAAPARPAAEPGVEVVVTLAAPPLAEYRPARTLAGRRLS